MSLTLYRKYRPQKWADLTNQNHIKVTLQNEIETGNIAHAYIFTGPRGIGKTTTARILAKAINCQERKDGESEPCNKCDSCLELTAGHDLDILEVDAASQTGVDNVRENIIANARFTPAKRKYKVFIIDEVHMLSVQAFNALLKTLEEPPAHAIFILATTEIHKVPATIISRCQRFDFRKINSQELIKRLNMIAHAEGVKISKEVLTDIARFSEGCLRDAESLLGQVLSLGEKEIGAEEASLIIPSSNFQSVTELMNALVLKNTQDSIALINKLVNEGVDLVQFTDDLIEFLRRMLISKISTGLKDYSFDLDQEMEKNMMDLSRRFEISQLIKLINLFTAKKFEIKSAVITQLPLEIAVIEYCQQADEPGQKDINKKNNGPKQPSGGAGSDDSSPANNQAPPEQDSKITFNKKQLVDKPPTADQPESNNNISDKNQGGVSNTTLNSANLADKQAKADVNKKTKVTLEAIKEKWNSFLVKLQEYNASLVFILKIAEPLELNGNILKLGFRYDFHQKRVCQAKICESVEKVLKDFFGEELFLATCLLAKDYQSDFINQQTKEDEVELVEEIPLETDSSQEDLINKLVNTFGGKIVE